MSKKERWLFAFGLLSGILPFMVVASSLQLLPGTVEIVVSASKASVVVMSKYNYLFLGLFCLVPTFLVVSARLLKGKGVVGSNFVPMVISGLVLGIAFLLVGVYGVVYQLVSKRVDLLRNFDFIGFSTVSVCVLFGLLANFLPDLKLNDFIGFKNKYTISSHIVWGKVHADMGQVFMYVYFALALALSAVSIWLNYSYSYLMLIAFLVCTVALFWFAFYYSKRVANKYNIETTAILVQKEPLQNDN